MRSLRFLGIMALFALFFATPGIGSWVTAANASTGPMTNRPESLNAPANDNDFNDNEYEDCGTGNPRKDKKCHYNSPNGDNDNIGDGSGDQPPSLEASVTSADPIEGDTIGLTLHAWGNEIDQVWWWVPNVISDNGNDNDRWMTEPQVASCDGADDCSRSFELKTHNSGTITVYAKARDRFGRETGEVMTEVRIHED